MFRHELRAATIKRNNINNNNPRFWFEFCYRYYFPCNRWLAIDEDDGQIGRELVPVDEAFMKKDDDEEGAGATLGLEQKGFNDPLWFLNVRTLMLT